MIRIRSSKQRSTTDKKSTRGKTSDIKLSTTTAWDSSGEEDTSCLWSDDDDDDDEKEPNNACGLRRRRRRSSAIVGEEKDEGTEEATTESKRVAPPSKISTTPGLSCRAVSTKNSSKPEEKPSGWEDDDEESSLDSLLTDPQDRSDWEESSSSSEESSSEEEVVVRKDHDALANLATTNSSVERRQARLRRRQIRQRRKKADELKEVHEYRDKIFSRLIKRGALDSHFAEQIKENEAKVRALELEQIRLLMGEERKSPDSAASETDEKKKKTTGQLAPAAQDNACGTAIRKQSWWSLLLETLTFERYSTAPAVFSLIVHCFAHHGLYDCISTIMHEAKKLVYQLNTQIYEDWLNLGVIILGIVLMRLSGYLFWWLSDDDYDVVKFEYHNRLRLGRWDAQVMHWVKQHDVLRCTLFTLGYTLVYMTTGHFFSRLELLLDQREALLESLPSRQTELGMCLNPREVLAVVGNDDEMMEEVVNSANTSTCPAFSPLQYPFACHTELERYLEEVQELREEDAWYTWKVMSSDSHDAYWSEINEGLGDQQATLVGPYHMFCFCAATTVVCIALLRAYGFIFWYKY